MNDLLNTRTDEIPFETPPEEPWAPPQPELPQPVTPPPEPLAPVHEPEPKPGSPVHEPGPIPPLAKPPPEPKHFRHGRAKRHAASVTSSTLGKSDSE
ncbi:MAG: hypothetical protein HY000_40315 [Planctomycetes bacterium]|nr:hypothetical protein [Planctomycetota bacterium]